MQVPDGLRYTKEHEWLKMEGDKTAIVGITDFAQQSLGDITYVELPNVGDEVTRLQTFGVVESVKAVSDLYSPVTGKVVEVNAPLVDAPETLNTDPYDKGWMLKIEISEKDDADLMSATDYHKFVEDNS